MTYCPGCNQSIHAESENEHLRKSIANSDRDHWFAEAQRLREALEWIRHQTGVSTCDDAIGLMNDVYEEATEALGVGCDRCGQAVALRYVVEYGANFCERCAADPQALPPFNPDPELSDSLGGKYPPLGDLREPPA